MNLRQHQLQTVAALDAIVRGAPTRRIDAVVTPGGGKSLLPVATAARLIPAGIVDRLCWVVPRDSLRYQAETNFADPRFRALLNHRLLIRSATNEADPCRGLAGFATTYQAVAADTAGRLADEFRRRRYAIVLDEYHHCEMDGVWAGAMQPLFDAAAFRLLMTGTCDRGDRQPIAFIPYNGDSPDLSTSPDRQVIVYGRTDALAERAIIPLHCYFHDGAVRWMKDTGVTVEYSSIARVPRNETAAAIYTAISTEFARGLMDRAVRHWNEYRRTVRSAQLLVVTAGKKHADAALEYLRRVGLDAALATSHESAKALAEIKRFRRGETRALVTIAMAYEGLDCPAVSHICCLTHIRSAPWIEQMLARAVRVAPGVPYDLQRAFVFAPDDPLLRAVIDRIRAEQAPVLKPRQRELFDSMSDDKGAAAPGDDIDHMQKLLGITPVASELTGHRDLLIGSNGRRPVWMEQEQPVMTPSEREEGLRAKIESRVRLFAFANRYKNQRINAELKARFGKSREDMTLEELSRVFDHVREHYPITGGRRATIPGVSPPRGGGRRCSTRGQFWTTIPN